MARGFYVYEPALGELSRELRKAVATGRMHWQDAYETMKKAIRKAIDEKAVLTETFDCN